MSTPGLQTRCSDLAAAVAALPPVVLGRHGQDRLGATRLSFSPKPTKRPLPAAERQAARLVRFAGEAFAALQQVEPDPVADAEREAIQAEAAPTAGTDIKDWTAVDAWLPGAFKGTTR